MNKYRFVVMWLALVLMAAPAFAQYGYNLHRIQVKDELGRPITDLTSVSILTGASEQTIYQDAALTTEVTNPITTESTNTTLTQASGTVYWYGVDAFNITVVSTAYGTATLKGYNGSTGLITLPTYWSASQSQTTTDAQSLTLGTDSDWVLSAGSTATVMTMMPGSNDSQLHVGNGSYTADLWLYGATTDYNCVWDASENTLELWDNVVLAVGTGDDFTISHNGTTTTVAGAYSNSGVVTFSTDVLFDGTYDISYDDDRYQLLFEDSAVLGLGGAHDAAGDITFVYNGTDLLMEAAAADDLWKIGYTTNFDIGIYGDTNTDLVYFDTSGELVYLDGFDVRFNDGDFLKFGDDSDWTIDSSTTKILDIVPLTTDETSAIYVGADAAGADLKVFGATSGDYLLWDASDDYLHMVGDLVLFTLAEAAANQFKVDATGTVAGNAIVLETTAGGIELNADGATQGDISVDSADDMTLTAGGDLTLAVTGTVSAGGALITNVGRPIELFTDDDTLAATESGKVCVCDGNDGGAANVILTLPAAATGLTFTFVDANATAADDLYIKAGSGDTINGGTAAQYIACKTDSGLPTVTLVAVDATRWVITAADPNSTVWAADDSPD